MVGFEKIDHGASSCTPGAHFGSARACSGVAVREKLDGGLEEGAVVLAADAARGIVDETSLDAAGELAESVDCVRGRGEMAEWGWVGRIIHGGGGGGEGEGAWEGMSVCIVQV